MSIDVYLRHPETVQPRDPEAFRPYEPANRWGTYGVLLAFSKRYLTACIAWPEAMVEVSR